MTVSNTFSIITLLLFLGAAHGFYLTFTSAFKGKTIKANRFLSILLLSYSISLLNAFLALSGYMKSLKFLLGIDMPFLFLIGPAFYLYVGFILGEKVKFKHLDYLHFSPAVIAFLVALPYYIKPGNEKVIYALDNSPINLPVERAWYMAFQLLVTGIYLIYAFRIIQTKRKKNSGWKWLKNTQIALWALSIIYTLSVPTYFILDNYLAEIRIVFWISISLFIHLIGFLMLKESHILGKKRLSNVNDASIDEKLLNVLEDRIIKYMKESSPFLQSGFTLGELSAAINSNSLYTSTVLNQSFGKSFSEFVNAYRVAKAKELLLASDMKLFAVALESGFSNKNSFNRVFKKATGLTPSEYKLRNQVTI